MICDDCGAATLLGRCLACRRARRLIFGRNVDPWGQWARYLATRAVQIVERGY